LTGCGRKIGPYDCCTVVCGDCLELMKALPDGCVDAVITDPPYFQPATHYCPTRDGGRPKKSIGDMSILETVFRVWCAEMFRALSPTGTVYFFCDGQSYPIAFTAMYPYAAHVRPIVWDKLTSYNGYTWRHQHELIAWAELKGTPRVPTGDGDILKYSAVPVGERKHPAEKPLDLLLQLIEKHAAKTILDPFLGSGTAAVAAKKLGRHFLGFEINPEYCRIAEERIALVEMRPTLFEKRAEQMELGR
jgi:DNA modification methylase